MGVNLNSKGTAALKAFLLLAPSEDRTYGKYREGTTCERER